MDLSPILMSAFSGNSMKPTGVLPENFRFGLFKTCDFQTQSQASRDHVLLLTNSIWLTEELH